MHTLAFIPGKGWPNLLLGHSETHSGLQLTTGNRRYICRLELDTPLTEDEHRKVRSALGPGGVLQDAIDTILAARKLQKLPDRSKFVEAAILTEDPGTPPSLPSDPFSIRLEVLKDAGKDATFPIFVRFTVDVAATYEPKMDAGDILAATKDAVDASPTAQKVIVAFGLK